MSVSKIVIADDHPLFRNALSQALSATMQGVEFLEAASISELEKVLLENDDIDLLLMDLHMPGANGFVGLAHVINNNQQLPIVVISANEELEIIASTKRFGALGFIPKSASVSQIFKAIEMVLSGEMYFPYELDEYSASNENSEDRLIKLIAELTPKQLEVFNLLSEGLLNKQIAYEQNVTEATVKAHVTAIMRKLNVTNRTKIILIANKVKIEDNFGADKS